MLEVEKKIRNTWKHYLEGQKCIIFILNISDKERLDYYTEIFNFFLDLYKNHSNIPIIIFGNIFNDKIEFQPEEMLQKCKFPPQNSTYIIKGNILKNEGIPELLDCIYNNIEFVDEKVEKKIEEKKKEEYIVKMFGLDNVGKTKILYLLKEGKKVLTINTIGFNIETIDKETWGKSITIWDIGGHEKIRNLWSHHLENSNGIIWVYDISDNKRIEESQNGLKKLLDDPKINNDIPLLIFANKSDLNSNGNKKEKFLEGIQNHINNRPYFIKECNVNDPQTYNEGIDWLYSNLH